MLIYMVQKHTNTLIKLFQDSQHNDWEFVLFYYFIKILHLSTYYKWILMTGIKFFDCSHFNF